MSEPSTATQALVLLLRSMPEPFAPRAERAAWLREKARVLRLIAAEYETEAVESGSVLAKSDAAGARHAAVEAERVAGEWEGEAC